MRRFRLMLLVTVMLGVGCVAAWPRVRTEAERASPVVTPVYPPGTVVLGAATGEPLVDLPLVLPNPIFGSFAKVIPDDVRTSHAAESSPRRV